MPSSLLADRYEAVAAVLKAARQEVGMTQVELATRLQRPQSYVSKVERRERRVDPVEFYDWERALGFSQCALYERLVKVLG